MQKDLLDFWISNNLNVLFVGKHGVGKSAQVKECFKKHFGDKWKYFSVPTMDPWVDFVGVPKEVKDESGQSYLELIRPREFQNDEVEALFFDEFNRGSDKVRNAVMELIQFRTINGHSFKNLKVIWAAINPWDEDGTYNVEKVDYAQLDRFEIHVDVPYEPDRDYFDNRYGKDMSSAAIEWWNAIDEKIKNFVSPRRLQYALDYYKIGGSLKDILPKDSNPSRLSASISSGAISDQLLKFLNAKDYQGAKAFLDKENNYYIGINWIVKIKERMDFFLPLLGSEKLCSLASEEKAFNFMIENAKNKSSIAQALNSILAANTNKPAVRAIKRKMDSCALTKKAVKNPKDAGTNWLNPQTMPVESSLEPAVINTVAPVDPFCDDIYVTFGDVVLCGKSDGSSRNGSGKILNPLPKRPNNYVDRLSAELTAILNSIRVTTLRKNGIAMIRNMIVDNILEEEIYSILKVVDLHANHSYEATLMSTADDYMFIINACISQLVKTKGVDYVAKAMRKYRKIVQSLVDYPKLLKKLDFSIFEKAAPKPVQQQVLSSVGEQQAPADKKTIEVDFDAVF